MAPKIPRGFGGSKPKVDDAPLSKARPLSKKSCDQRDLGHKDVGRMEVSKKDGKRQMESFQEVTPSKKLKSQSAPSTHVANLFGPISAAYVGENAVHKWQSLAPEAQDLSMIEAAAQLVVQTIGRAQRCQEERLAFEKLRADNTKLAEMIVETDNKWKKDLDAKTADFEVLTADYKESVTHRDHLNSLVEQLEKDKEDMQARIDSLEKEKSENWARHGKTLRDEGFQEGFDFYLLAFMAQEPDYDWSKWGEECAEDMAKFKVERADDIQKKRVELGLERGAERISSPCDSILNDHEGDNPGHLPSTPVVPPPGNQSTPTVDAPSETGGSAL